MYSEFGICFTIYMPARLLYAMQHLYKDRNDKRLAPLDTLVTSSYFKCNYACTYSSVFYTNSLFLSV